MNDTLFFRGLAGSWIKAAGPEIPVVDTVTITKVERNYQDGGYIMGSHEVPIPRDPVPTTLALRLTRK